MQRRATMPPASPARRKALLAAGLLISGMVMLPATGRTDEAAAAASPAVSILLQQARFWAGQGKTDAALASLRRLLRLDPHSPGGLALAAQLAVPPAPTDAAPTRAQRARQLRAQAEASPDPATRVALLRAASAAALYAALPRPPPGAATVLWTGAPADLTMPASLSADPDGSPDSDPVVITGHLLDTEATDLPPPTRAPAGPPAYPPSPFAARMPRPPAASAVLRAADIAVPAVDAEASGLASPPDLTPPAGGAATGAPPEPIASAMSDAEGASLTGQPVPGAQVGMAFRGRSGSSGTSRLGEVAVPLEAQFAAGGDGRLGLAVTPTFLSAGSVSGDAGARAQFGTLALGASQTPLAIPRQTADGAGLDVAYRRGSLSADIGSTPLGFAQQNVVGGVEWVPTVGDGVRLRLTGERRAITDSLLSYAGTTDPLSGQKWGGVTTARGHANLEFSVGPADLYVGGGGGALDGRNVKGNAQWETGAGGSFAVLKTTESELRLGLDLVYFSYRKNLDGFTLGQGGYFSPQAYFAALLPVEYRQRLSESLSYEIGGAVGVQSYRADASPRFPRSGALQSALLAQQANAVTAVPGAGGALPGRDETGFAGGAHGLIDYRVTGNFHVGAKVDYEHTGNYNQTTGLAFGRYLLNGPEPSP